MDDTKQSSADPRGYPAAPGYGVPGYGTPGYGAPGYGGYPGAAETTAQRTLQDYFLILRERIWYILITLVVVFTGSVLYTKSRIPLYQSTATVEVFRRAPTVMQVQQVMDTDVRSAEDLNTQVNILKSSAIVQQVAGQLKGPTLERFLAPYRTEKSPNPTAHGILSSNREIVPQRLSLILSIRYTHPDAEIAGIVANLFADAYISYSTRMRVAETTKAVDELSIRADEQRKKVNDIQKSLQEYREKNKLVSLDQRKDINTETLKALNVRVTESTTTLQMAETRRRMLQAAKSSGADLLSIPEIGGDPNVASLKQGVAAAEIKIIELGAEFRAKHPQMLEAVRSLEESRRQLASAIATAEAQVENAYQNALQNDQKAREALLAQEKESLALAGFLVDYTNMVGDFELNEKILQSTMSRMRETEMSSAVETQNARLLDRAVPGGRISPNVRLNLSLGLAGGLGLGLMLAFVVAFIDDRIKSTFDIEGVVGLPLLTIIPKFQKSDKGNEPSPNSFSPPSEQEVAEAFSTLYSGIRVKEAGKPVQCIVITSTIPGEGKSFITRNLAMSFAAHGERTILIDCDLRRPVVHRSFEMENLKGVIDLCNGTAKLDDVIVKEVQPNMDVLPSGGRSKHPAQNLSSKNFEVMLSDLRKRYHRILIDTPPVALVSDALVILPLADGSIYSIFFNKVRRKAAQFCVQRILEVNVTHFGAVLNGLDRNMGGYYYHHYYDKKYKGYYAAASDDGGPPARGRTPSRKPLP